MEVYPEIPRELLVKMLKKSRLLVWVVNIMGMGIPAGFVRVLPRVRVREFVPIPVPVPAALICP
jgi:hypothetical protein